MGGRCGKDKYPHNPGKNKTNVPKGLNTRHTRAKRFNSVLMNVWCVCIIDYGRQIVIMLYSIVYVLGVQCIPGVDNKVCGLRDMEKGYVHRIFEEWLYAV